MALYQLSYWPTQRGQKDSGDGCPWEPIQSADLARFPRRSERRRRGGGPCRTAPRAVHLTAAPPAAPRSGRAPEPTSHRDTPAGPRSRQGRGGTVGESGPTRARQGEGRSERGPRRPPEPGHHGPLPPLGHAAAGVAPIRERGAPQPWRFGARATGSTGDWEHGRLGARVLQNTGESGRPPGRGGAPAPVWVAPQPLAPFARRPPIPD